MIYKFRLLSDEVEDFRRDIEIDSDASFLDLHKAILSSVNYPDDQMTSFFICNDNWIKEVEITLEDMGSRSDEDNYVMADTVISDLIEEEKQHLMYVFDPLADRVFFMELSKIEFGKSLDEARCVKTIGDAPVQVLDFDALMNKQGNVSSEDDFNEDFYGSDDFNEEDLDGLDLDNIPDGSSIDDLY